uniref:Uncharacterized protein n=1 Tax=Aplanochytrium stocchinoi TaxID=215587 RepID=A0A7S3LRF4_9STRA|mmetsp:Transcript_1692/g.2015  ORF Transcript_1692/g.2015 Transcript_1692/m.2015 type:complete len:376 (+) Transcript_1692:91-1218(+)
MSFVKRYVSNLFSCTVIVSVILLVSSFSFTFLRPYSGLSSSLIPTNANSNVNHHKQVQVHVPFKNGYVDFEVVSEFQEPVLYISVSSLEKESECVHFVLGDGIHDFDFDFEVKSMKKSAHYHFGAQAEILELHRLQVVEEEKIAQSPKSIEAVHMRWTNLYRLYVSPPKGGAYSIALRLEHTSMQEALRDYNSNFLTNSYLGELYRKEFVFRVDDHDSNLKKLESDSFSQTEATNGIWFCRDTSYDMGTKASFYEHEWPYEAPKCGESLLKQPAYSFSRKRTKKCRKITIIGDSQPSYSCLRLKNASSSESQEISNSRDKHKNYMLDVACINIKGALSVTDNNIQKYTHSREFYYGKFRCLMSMDHCNIFIYLKI